MSGIDVLAVIDVEIADRRREGDTGNVENLIEARAAVAELIEAARSVRPCFHCEGDTFGEFDGLIAALSRVQGVSA